MDLLIRKFVNGMKYKTRKLNKNADIYSLATC